MKKCSLSYSNLIGKKSVMMALMQCKFQVNYLFDFIRIPIIWRLFLTTILLKRIVNSAHSIDRRKEKQTHVSTPFSLRRCFTSRSVAQTESRQRYGSSWIVWNKSSTKGSTFWFHNPKWKIGYGDSVRSEINTDTQGFDRKVLSIQSILGVK